MVTGLLCVAWGRGFRCRPYGGLTRLVSFSSYSQLIRKCFMAEGLEKVVTGSLKLACLTIG